MKPVLEISNISKKFRINHEQRSYLSLRDRLSDVFKAHTSTEDFWALKDVSFNVHQGENIGIIGKNGAGKSTLLKILSKITPPTTGKITSRGRIASLLEVGTGFHTELSGRENIFMNGSILGMRRVEILKNFDAIVDFSGVEKFIDTPLKHYSSGMQLRLAFAVAAFLENEILIIDEVLAVGDAEFQKKCMGKMGEVSKSGRTILFVSHNMYALSLLCEKSVLLEKGELKKIGPTSEIVDYYNSKELNNHSSTDSLIPAGKNIILKDLNIKLGENETNTIEFKIQFLEEDILASLVLFITNSDGLRIAIIDCRTENYPLRANAGSSNSLSINIKELPFIEGDYYIGAYIESNFFKGNIENIARIHPHSKKNSNSLIIEYPKQYRGIIELKYDLKYKPN